MFFLSSSKEWKRVAVIVLAFFLLVFVQANQQLLSGRMNSTNIELHVMLVSFNILIVFLTFFYRRKVFSNIRSFSFLVLSIVFLAVGSFDFMHILTYKGMPFFTTESKTAWFWIFSHLTMVGTFACLVGLKKNVSSIRTQWQLFGSAILYITSVIILISIFESSLPLLYIGLKPTFLFHSFKSVLCFFYLIISVTAFVLYKRERTTTLLDLSFAFSFLFLSEFGFLINNGAGNLSDILSHLYRFISYFILFRGFIQQLFEMSFYKELKARTELKNILELMDSFFSHTPDAFIILNQNGIILFANIGLEKIYGWKAEEVIGKDISILSPNATQEYENFIPRVFAGECIHGYETIRTRKDQSQIHISMSLWAIRDHKGNVINIAGIARDITDRKIAEESAKKAQEDLEQTISKQNGIIFKFKKIDDQFIHTFFNGGILYQQHLTSKEVKGKLLQDFFNEEEACLIEKYYTNAWNGNNVTYEQIVFDRIFAFTLKPIIQNGKVIEVIGSGIDITKLKKTEELLRKSEKLAVVGELAAGVDHEIRNPLTTLKGFIQLFSEKLDSDNKPFVQLMLSEVDRIEMITSEFMAVAKPQAVHFKMNDVMDIIHQVVTFLQPQALLHNIEINVLNEAENTNILCDGNQLKQVFINLMKNAFEAMSTGGKLTVQITDVNQTYLRFSIKDTGCGIPEEIIPKLGEPFYTLKEKGTGLGLMVSYRIIEAHQGKISFQSVVNQGTTVDLELPYHHENENANYSLLSVI